MFNKRDLFLGGGRSKILMCVLFNNLQKLKLKQTYKKVMREFCFNY
jgi:hypothetical protein